MKLNNQPPNKITSNKVIANGFIIFIPSRLSRQYPNSLAKDIAKPP